MRTGTTNQNLRELISELKKKSLDEKVNIWKRIAADLEKPTRQKRVVNLSRINRHSKEDEIVIVPGKVLGSGVLEHKLLIAAFDFSESAKEKIKSCGAEALSIRELMEKNAKAKNVRIIG